MTKHAAPAPVVAVVLTCFALSGATALVYEVVWLRMLGLVFGHTVAAVTTVLVAFMAGLGAGGLAFGPLADRVSRPVRLYGIIEIAVGISALGVTLLTPAAEAGYVALARAFEPAPVLFAAGRLGLALLLLLVPTTLMGATLPVLSRALAAGAGKPGARVGALYALNTAGAVAGTALAGYLLLPSLGMRVTVLLTAVANVLIGMAAIAVDHVALSRPPDADRLRPPAALVASDIAGPRLAWLAQLGLAVSGAAAMTYEIAWTRGLALVIGSSTYAFTAMLVSFLAGIALGSGVAATVCRTRRGDATGFGLVQVGAAAAALAILPTFDRMPDVLARTFTVSMAPGFVLVVQLVVAILAMAAPAALLGAAFPVAVALASPGAEHIGSRVGRLYAANTAGAITGTLLAGFALIPAVGAHATVKAAVIANVAAGAVALATGTLRQGWRPAIGAVVAVATLAGVALLPAWDRTVMASGVAVYGDVYRKQAGTVSVAEAQGDSELVFHEDGLSATVTVHRRGGDRFLRINGKTDASTGRDMHTQLMLGHLPLLLHPGARTALVVGLGSGVTAAAVARHPVQRIDVVEIEPAVVRASRFFEPENRDVLRDPRVRLSIGDARNVLLGARERYDVIASEPSNPWIGGIAALYTEEFYALARKRLAPGGVMVQWVQGYGLDPDDLRMIVRTFLSSFPATTVWYPNVRGDYLLAGRAEPRPIDLAGVRAVWNRDAGLREDLGRRGVASPYAFLADFLLTETETATYAGRGPLNTDDRLPLEFSAPLSMHRDTEALNFRHVTSVKREPRPLLAATSADELDRAHARYAIALVHLAKEAPARAIGELERALAREPAHVPSMLALASALARVGLPVRAVDVLLAVLAREPTNPDAHLQLSRLYRLQQIPDAALDHARRAVALASVDSGARVHLAALLSERGLVEEAIEHSLAARSVAPADALVADRLATLYLARGRTAEAIRVLQETLATAPDNAQLLARAGRAYLLAGRHGEAVTALERAVIRSPTEAAAHADLGAAYLGLGRVDAGIRALRRSLDLDPAQPAARALLDQAQLSGRARGYIP
ncbi:MAG: fused MFS/spermidine synthase [Candidatus Rokubacteria bacterium]|nr:fused MFS/spermidine synthase [Candidatus Rokubacteria bacterium]